MALARSLTVAFLAAMLAAPIVVTVAAPRVALATHISDPACPNHDQLAYAEHIPHVNADGASSQWRATTLVAPGYAGGGFSAQVLWVGTDGYFASDVWVETGVTKGFGGQNVFKFYSAHGDVRPNPDIYVEVTYGPTPVVGSTNIYRAYSISPTPGGTPRYQTRVTAGGTNYLRDWLGHVADTRHYASGFEVRYGGQQCSHRVDATYFYNNTFRRASDGININPNNGVLTDASTQGTIGWCVNPTTHRAWVHSQTSGDVCP